MRFAVKIAIFLESVYDYFFPPALFSQTDENQVDNGQQDT